MTQLDPARATPGDPRVAEIFRRFEAMEPAPKPELEYVDPFTLLVSVVLSAQATDVSVNKATRPLFQAAPTPAAMAALGVEGITPFIKSIGLFNTKAKNVIALSQQLLDHHGGAVPLERAAMQALPGVGRKTASVVLNELGVEPAIAVDTHVFRVSHRLALSTGKTPDAVEAELMRVVPAPYLTRAHHWLILHGRYVCAARRPKCEACPLVDLCPTGAVVLGSAIGIKP
jgi:endonuclease-3